MMRPCRSWTVVARPDPSMGGPTGGSGAYAIRALSDLCFGMASHPGLSFGGHQRRDSRNGTLWNILPIRGSVRLDARELDHLGPLLGFLGNEFPEIGGRERDHGAAALGKPRLDLGISKAGVDLLV